VPDRHSTFPETRSPEDIVNDYQCGLAVIASDVDAIECAVGCVGALGGVVQLDRWDRTAGLVGVVHGRHGSDKWV
jgi:hypothetical protein